MTNKARNNFVAYGILTGTCLVVALIGLVFPNLFAHGPPVWQLLLSLRGTIVISLLGLFGILFLNRSSLRGLWDRDLRARQKVLIPLIAGMVFGLVSVTIRRFTPFGAVAADYVRSQGAHAISPVARVLAYLSGGILINIIYFLILIPPVVYLASDRLLRGQKQGVVYWSIATPLALWEPLTNFPPALSLGAFGTVGAVGVFALGAALPMMQAWFMRRSGFVALVSARFGAYAIIHYLFWL
jgi:hypothetical protein